MSTQNIDNTQNTLNALIDRTLSAIDKGLDRSVGDMNLMQAMEFVGILMDIRERQQSYLRKQNACQNACVKKPISNNTNGLKNGGNKLYENKG